MSDEESELAGYDVRLEAKGPAEGALGRREWTAVGAIPYEWLVSIRSLLGKYYRGCLDCKGGRCAKCVQAERWMTRLDYHLAGARRLARKRAVEAAEQRRRVAAAREADAKLTPEERRQKRLEMEEAVRLGCATAYEAEDSFSARFKKEGL